MPKSVEVTEFNFRYRARTSSHTTTTHQALTHERRSPFTATLRGHFNAITEHTSPVAPFQALHHSHLTSIHLPMQHTNKTSVGAPKRTNQFIRRTVFLSSPLRPLPSNHHHHTLPRSLPALGPVSAAPAEADRSPRGEAAVALQGRPRLEQVTRRHRPGEPGTRPEPSARRAARRPRGPPQPGKKSPQAAAPPRALRWARAEPRPLLPRSSTHRPAVRSGSRRRGCPRPCLPARGGAQRGRRGWRRGGSGGRRGPGRCGRGKGPRRGRTRLASATWQRPAGPRC